MTGNSLAPAQAGTSIEPAVRDLAALALDTGRHFQPSALIEAGISADQAIAALAAIDEQLIPAKVRDPQIKAKSAIRLRDNLGLIGRKIRPELSAEAAKDWVGALVIALSDLPYRVTIEASAQAIHSPFEYLSQVETEIRRLATEIETRFSVAKSRLDRLHRLIINPPKQIPSPEPMVWTQDHIDDLGKTKLGRALRNIGVGNGWIIDNGDGTYSPAPIKEDDKQ